jgi:hypothetical protein
MESSVLQLTFLFLEAIQASYNSGLRVMIVKCPENAESRDIAVYPSIYLKANPQKALTQKLR